MRPFRWFAYVLVVGLGLALLSRPIVAEQIFQYGFEARGTVWKAGNNDAARTVLAHELTTDSAHGGQRSEHIRLQVERGSYIHYTYDVPRAPITDELAVSLWLKSNRPGIQLLCRIVLPNERDPDLPNQDLTVLVRCEPYNSTRWKLVDLRQPMKRLREQQQLLAARLKKPIDIGRAYIDQLVLNVCDGTGVIDVYIDDLEIGPVLDVTPPAEGKTPQSPVARTPGVPTSGNPSGSLPRNTGTSEVRLEGSQLNVDGKRFLMRGIRHTGTPLPILRDAGFNTVWLDESASPALLKEAANLNLRVVPSLRPPPELFKPADNRSQEPTSIETFSRHLGRFLENDNILAWDLGSNLGADDLPRSLALAKSFRAIDPNRPVVGDVWDGSRGYIGTLHGQLMLGTHRWPLGTSFELTSYRDWLENRRRPLAYHWTWIQTHMPDWYVQLVNDGNPKAKTPGPQSEQIRLLAYLALAAGYRGLAFWTDRTLADNVEGKERLMGLALLNQELRLLEPIIASATREPEWISTSRGEVKAAVIRSPAGVLVLPIWIGPGSQYVPGQDAVAELRVVVPVAITSTAWEISAGRIRSHPIQRVQGGSQVTLHNFSLTSALLFTSDLAPKGLIVELQKEQRKIGKLAAQWLIDEAKEKLAHTEEVQNKLDAVGHSIPDAHGLLKKAKESIEKAQRQRDGEHADAYASAEVAMRALRVLMRASWEKAVFDLDTPVASPYALRFDTLPRHWEMLDQMKTMRAGENRLPYGDFELPPDDRQPGWVVQELPSLDSVVTRVRRVPYPADPARKRGGKQCVMIDVLPKDKERPPALLERTFVALHSPAVRLTPGTLVRVSAWVRTKGPLTASTDGALFYDSIGGEPLAVRIGHEPKWKKYSLFRRVPASGQVFVTLANSGMGTVYFDDVRIEPLDESVARGKAE